MRHSRRKTKRRTLLIVLLVISAAGLLLPGALTGKLISLVQVLVPFQDWSTRTASGTAELLGAEPAAPTRAQAAELARENAALRNRLASLAGNYQQLERDYADVAGIRRRGLRGGRLVPARVVGEDIVPWRDSRLVSAGSLRGVRRHAAVTSNRFSIAPDRLDAVTTGEMVLAGEVLVGFVEQVGTHTARVRMLTDRQTALNVTIARRTDDNFHPLDAEFWLVGTGKPQLEIRDVDHRYIRSESIRIGDTVLTVASDPQLPVALTVGTISAILPDPDNGLLYRLVVDPGVAAHDLSSVFVVDLTSQPDS